MKNARPLRENRQHGDYLFPFSVYQTRVGTDYPTPLYYHWHPEIEIFFVTAGRAGFQVEGEPIYVEEGDVLLIKPNALHGSHDDLSIPLEFRAIVFGYEFVAGMGNDRVEQKYLKPLFYEQKSRYILLKGKQENKELFEVLNRIFDLCQSAEEGYELLLRAWLLQAVYVFYLTGHEEIAQTRAMNRKSTMMRRIIAYVEDNYAGRILLSQAAQLLSVSEGYLCRFFKENFHMTFVEYVMRVRMQKAEILLLHTDQPVGQIALDTGFTNGNYFTSSFRRYYHMTPQKFRKERNL